MSGRSASNDRARRDAWRKIDYPCPCGRVVHGNGRSHQRTCETHLREAGWPLDTAMADAVRNEYRGQPGVVSAVERELGRFYLARRQSGDRTALAWLAYRDLVWQYAE